MFASVELSAAELVRTAFYSSNLCRLYNKKKEMPEGISSDCRGTPALRQAKLGFLAFTGKLIDKFTLSLVLPKLVVETSVTGIRQGVSGVLAISLKKLL